MANQQLMSVQGRIVRMIRPPQNSSSDWTVFQISPDRKSGTHQNVTRLLKVVGNCHEAQKGIHVQVQGKLETNNRYGEQLTARSITPVLASNEKNLRDTLIDNVKGLTAFEADSLLNRMGMHLLVDALNKGNEDQLVQAGLESSSAKTMIAKWQSMVQVYNLRSTAKMMGFPENIVARIVKNYENTKEIGQVTKKLKENPFVVDRTMGALSADDKYPLLEKIAIINGAELRTPERWDSAIEYSLTCAENMGHTFLDPQFAFTEAARIANLQVDNPEQRVEAQELVGRLPDLVQNQRVLFTEKNNQPRVSLYETGQAERNIARRLQTLADTRPNKYPVPDKTEQARKAINLTGCQSRALDQALRSKAMVLTGDPGTGKTTLVDTLLKCFPDDAKVLLLAPTGQAASHLSNKTGHEAATIHRFLKKFDNASQKDKPNPDIIILDETSMIDSRMMSRLLDGIPNKSRLIAMGDINQLPSIGSGAILRDMTNSWIPSTHLDEVRRQKEDSPIIQLATHVREGINPDKLPNNKDYQMVSPKTDDEIKSSIKKRIKQLLSDNNTGDSIQVLVPTNVGKLGTNQLNSELRPFLHPNYKDNDRASILIGGNKKSGSHGAGNDVYVGDRVLQSKNDYNSGLHNGMRGTVVDVDRDKGTLTVDFLDTHMVYDADKAEELQLDYVTTIHRSQGSQYPNVIIAMGGDGQKSSPSVDRNSLYTGITRAENSVTLIGHPEQFKQVVTQNPSESRHTALPYELANHWPEQTNEFESVNEQDNPMDETNPKEMDWGNDMEAG